MAWRLGRFLVATTLAIAAAASILLTHPASAQPLSAIVLGSSTIQVSLAPGTLVVGGDCAAAWAYTESNGGDKGGPAPFAGCTVAGSTLTLTYAGNVTYAAGGYVG